MRRPVNIFTLEFDNTIIIYSNIKAKNTKFYLLNANLLYVIVKDKTNIVDDILLTNTQLLHL